MMHDYLEIKMFNLTKKEYILTISKIDSINGQTTQQNEYHMLSEIMTKETLKKIMIERYNAEVTVDIGLIIRLMIYDGNMICSAMDWLTPYITMSQLIYK